MIHIIKNTSRNISLTLNELATLTLFDVLFKFVNDTTGETKIFSAQDISPATERYNEFVIIENAIEDLYNGKVELSPVGYWSYTIYEMAVTSPPDLDPTNAISILETGKVLVQSNAASTDVEFDDNDTKNNVVFE